MGFRNQQQKVIDQYRNLIKLPDTFEDGFSFKTVVAAILLGLLITPGALYISLVAGDSVGPAARWVTIFLFAEIAKRSLREMKQQEVFILYYMTAIILIQNTGILWNIYQVQSEAFRAMGINNLVPDWVVPKEALAAGRRTLFGVEWIPAILLVFTTLAIQRIDSFGLGYFLYRLTCDVEKLPFPVSSVSATGILAMAESKDPQLQWRPACFAIGGMIGMLFGLVYVGLPSITGILLRDPIYIIPIPWIELTPAVKNILPSSPCNIVLALGSVIAGMVLPFWVIAGGCIGAMVMLFGNPFLYKMGILHTWRPGMQTVDTLFSNQIDFYLSFTLGISVFIAIIGLSQSFIPIMRDLFKKVLASGSRQSDELSPWQILIRGNPKRGDMSIWISLAIYICSTVTYITASTYLVDGFPWMVFLIYGFVYTPLFAYATARVEGMAGQSLSIPYITEAAIILSGYKGVAIWFAPIPAHNYNIAVSDFRQSELAGVRMRGMVKTTVVCLPIILISLIVFSSVIWSQAPLNSNQYPYVQRVWDLNAKNRALIISSTMEGKRSMFFEALNGEYLLYGLCGGAAFYLFLTVFGLPTMLLFGLIRGLSQVNPMVLMTEMFGALLGRFYFQKKFGDMWLRYSSGIWAGFGCGVGLIGMISIALRLIAKSIAPLDY